MRLRKFILHENVPDIQVDESHFYTEPDVIDEPEHFHGETPQVTPTPAAFSSDTEESDHENPRNIIIHLELGITSSPTIDYSVHTTTSTQESPDNPVLNLPPEISHAPQTELQPYPVEDDNQDASHREVIHPEVSPTSCDVQPEAPEPVADVPAPSEPIFRALWCRYNLRRNPTPCNYQDYLLLEPSNKPALAKFMINKTA